MRLKLVTIGSSTGVIVPKRELEARDLAAGDEVDVTIRALQLGHFPYESITAHGRFQPPLHQNHWNYLREAFRLGKHVRLLITNPYAESVPEQFDERASWRSDIVNNPFSYEEREYMFTHFFDAMNIDPSRYTIEPFDITKADSFKKLHKSTPNLVNVYSAWSQGKAEKFRDGGLMVIQLDQPKVVDTSGTILRSIILKHRGSLDSLGKKLVKAGLMPEAVPALLEVIKRRNNNE